jgi:hypothetical protein
MWPRIWISLGLFFLLAPLAPSVGAEMLAPGLAGDRPVVQGTIRWADERGINIYLRNGQHLIVPLTINVRHVLMTPPRAIKAYYERTAEGDVVTLIVVEELQPGSGG